MIGAAIGRRHGPNGSTCRAERPISSVVPMAGVLLVNPRSGKASPTADELADVARARGIDAHVLQPGEDAAESARRADAQALGIAGGGGARRVPRARAAGRRRLGERPALPQQRLARRLRATRAPARAPPAAARGTRP